MVVCWLFFRSHLRFGEVGGSTFQKTTCGIPSTEFHGFINIIIMKLDIRKIMHISKITGA